MLHGVSLESAIRLQHALRRTGRASGWNYRCNFFISSRRRPEHCARRGQPRCKRGDLPIPLVQRNDRPQGRNAAPDFRDGTEEGSVDNQHIAAELSQERDDVRQRIAGIDRKPCKLGPQSAQQHKKGIAPVRSQDGDAIAGGKSVPVERGSDPVGEFLRFRVSVDASVLFDDARATASYISATV